MRRIGRFAAMVACAAGLLTVPSLSEAQQCTANGAPASCGTAGSVSMTAGRVVRLQLSTSSTALTAPTTADFDAGFNATTGPTLTVSANAPWTLSLRASSPVWTATNTAPGAPARIDKPAGDLNWSIASSGAFSVLTTSDATMLTGTATANIGTTLYFRTLYDWALDTPGNYSLSVVLTLTSP
jgi:hypothetical protein